MQPARIENAEYRARAPRTDRWWLGCLAPWLLAVLVFMAWPAAAFAQTAGAQCWFEDVNGNAINAPPPQTVTINPITIPLPTNPVAGNPIGSPVAATPSTGTIYIACGNNTNQGLQPAFGTYNPSNNIVYSPTPGVAFQILRSSNPIPIYPTGTFNGGFTYQFSNTTTFQLYSTGVLPSNGSQISAGTILGQWQIQNICIKNPVLGFFGNLQSCGTNAAVYGFMTFVSGGVTFTASTCSVAAGSSNIAVTLPTVFTNALGGTGATPGATSFAIQLTGCTTGRNVSATLDTSAPYAGANGVIAPTAGAGYAQNVGVQILQSNGTTPVTFGTSFSTGTTSGTSYTINLFARYYQTGTPATAGRVTATATYTLTYQ